MATPRSLGDRSQSLSEKVAQGDDGALNQGIDSRLAGLGGISLVQETATTSSSTDEELSAKPESSPAANSAPEPETETEALRRQLEELKQVVASLGGTSVSPRPTVLPPSTDVLLLYNPTQDKTNPTTHSAFTLTRMKEVVPATETAPAQVMGVGYTVRPGLQRKTAAEAEEMATMCGPTAKKYFELGILQVWATTTTLSALDSMKAQNAIGLCSDLDLLREWAGEYDHLPPAVQARLLRRQDELNIEAPSRSRELFNRTVMVS